MLDGAPAGGLLALGLLFGQAALWSGLVAAGCAAGGARPLTWGLGVGPLLGALRVGEVELELRPLPLGAWVRIGPADAPEAPPLAAGAAAQVVLLALWVIGGIVAGDVALSDDLRRIAETPGAGARLVALARGLWAAPVPFGLALLGAQGVHNLVGIGLQVLGRRAPAGPLLVVGWAFVPLLAGGVWLFK